MPELFKTSFLIELYIKYKVLQVYTLLFILIWPYLPTLTNFNVVNLLLREKVKAGNIYYKRLNFGELRSLKTLRFQSAFFIRFASFVCLLVGFSNSQILIVFFGFSSIFVFQPWSFTFHSTVFVAYIVVLCQASPSLSFNLCS